MTTQAWWSTRLKNLMKCHQICVQMNRKSIPRLILKVRRINRSCFINRPINLLALAFRYRPKIVPKLLKTSCSNKHTTWMRPELKWRHQNSRKIRPNCLLLWPSLPCLKMEARACFNKTCSIKPTYNYVFYLLKKIAAGVVLSHKILTYIILLLNRNRKRSLCQERGAKPSSQATNPTSLPLLQRDSLEKARDKGSKDSTGGISFNSLQAPRLDFRGIQNS